MIEKTVISEKNRLIYNWLLTITLIILASIISWFFKNQNFHESNIVIIYIFSVLITARNTSGFRYGIIASFTVTCLYNYFFTYPYLTFSVKDPTYSITFSIMTITSIITSTLTSKVRRKELETRNRELETRSLIKLTNILTDANNLEEIAMAAVISISEGLKCNSACLIFDKKNNPDNTFIQHSIDGIIQKRNLNQEDNDIFIKMKNLNSPYYFGNEFMDWPILSGENILGVIRIPVEMKDKLLGNEQRLLISYIESTAIAIDRYINLQERIHSREEIQQERFRSNLLRSISHDIRTPLSGIMGTAEVLLSLTDKNNPMYSLEEGIYNDAFILHTMTENILNLTRIQEGKLIINKEPEALEEVIGTAVLSMEKRNPGRIIDIDIPTSLVMIPMDSKLIHQVIINLLDNAINHTDFEEKILVSASIDEKNKEVVINVEDEGTGINPEELPNLFQLFFTTRNNNSNNKCGVGLGLPICESIIKAHSGRISAKNRENGKGAIFTFTLPLEGDDNIEE